MRGVNAWDGLKAFVQFAVRAPISPVPKIDLDGIAGRTLFQATCQQCHGGPQWTRSVVRFAPPPDSSLMVAGQVIG